MGLFHLKRKKKKTALPVQESIQTVIKMIADRFENEGWKYLKGRRMIKKKVGDLSFEIYFHSSKWNRMNDMIWIECGASIKYNKYNSDAYLIYFQYEPLCKDIYAHHLRYYDITYQESFESVVEDISNQLSQTIVLLARQFEKDFINTGIKIATKGLFIPYKEDKTSYDFSIRFIDEFISNKYARILAKNYYQSLDSKKKEKLNQDIEKYKRYKHCISSIGNEKYIIEHSDYL